MIVLDTNVISEIFRPRPNTRVVAWLEGITGDVAITAVTLAELLAGVRRLPDGKRSSALAVKIDAALEPYRETSSILPFDVKAAEHYADVLVAREKAGLPIHTADAQIAAICRAYGATCATRNVKDFNGTGVQVIDPWAA
ncbi:MAG TPA: type II toxin-antitoxin system VapC family toxin [Flexivirga sp.]|uniref:type II toxin-antitoxin system VapC family toxin n=1 Tax=Flexivirga sp. TaxID=1962927 RepID=UPI002C5F9C74|nr:type II toxin-antitoxin system VapC family toxin [Flexivirga sp.]HWC21526.1 type II toxin-antitoxin system VapC family toxin [Flexivirga sp.]